MFGNTLIDQSTHFRPKVGIGIGGPLVCSFELNDFVVGQNHDIVETFTVG